jgi:hypothetical protein
MPIINANGNFYKNATLKNLIDLFEDICTENSGIMSFSFGDIWEIETKERDYVVGHLSIENAQYLNNELQYDFKFYIMDLVSKDEGNENDVLSDTLQTIGDIVSKLKNGNVPNTHIDFENDYRLQEGIVCQPFTERFDNDVSGWVADISIRVSFNYSACTGDTM